MAMICAFSPVLKTAEILLKTEKNAIYNKKKNRGEITIVSPYLIPKETELIVYIVNYMKRNTDVCIKQDHCVGKMMFTGGAHAKRRNAGGGSGRRTSTDCKSPQTARVAADGYTYR
ncbi:hypothetical protein WN51_10198 [Melipona quadrifasciata]|uniref:Uncharacterized protein n=1 Tax=Melipona quadrifasciata TaxID=166423 RepID=A0A0M9A934_9HYME|nr:hypothetical protein WN51_10198 [Melipona quadrifasciata]